MTAACKTPERQVRALFTTRIITVYQAYPPSIAERALAEGTFAPPFKLERMTWIKPSFLWMMYRSGWATKPDQERVLAVQITREGFEWALGHSVLSSYEPNTYASSQEWAQRKRTSPVRIQWDPERSLLLEPLPWRSIQIGLSGEAVSQYVHEWITGLTDITMTAHEIRDLITAGKHQTARAMLPIEQPYELPGELRRLTGAT
jgi:hypothetical protein